MEIELNLMQEKRFGEDQPRLYGNLFRSRKCLT